MPDLPFAIHRFRKRQVDERRAIQQPRLRFGLDSLDWKKIFSAARTGGIKNYFVEIDLDKMKASVPYLRNLQA